MPADSKQPSQAIEVRLTDETISYLDKRIAVAVKEGINQVLTKETAQQFWAAGFEMLQEQAKTKAGGFVFGGVWDLLKHGVKILLLVWAAYSVFGWAGLSKVWHALFS